MKVRKGFAPISALRENSLASLLRITVCLLLVAVLACSPTRMPRGGMGPPPRGMPFPEQTPEEIISVMKERLTLTEEQEVKVKPIIDEHCEKRSEIIQKYREQGRNGVHSMRSDLQSLQELTEEKLSTVLTEEQVEEYHKMQEEQRQKMREQMKQRMGRGRRGGMGWPHGF